MTKTKKKTQRKAEPSTKDWFPSWKPWQQYVFPIILLLGACWIVFWPIISDDAAFSAGGDTAAYQSYKHAGEILAEKEGQDVLWMPYFFGGMPTFGNVAYVPQMVGYLEYFLFHILLNVLFLMRTWAWICAALFFGGVSMFILLQRLGLPGLASLLAALAFMLSPYAVGLPDVGHGSKLAALSYIPSVFLLAVVLMEGTWNRPLSVGLLAWLMGSLMLTTHVQIAYYALMLVGAYVVYTFAGGIKDGRARPFAMRALLVLAGLALAMLISSYIYLSVYEYAQFSIRGGGTAESTGGLTWEYATNWSWHPWEFVTLLIPKFFGFEPPYYWGPIEPWTSSSVYIGIIPIFLATVGAIYARNRLVWFLIIVTALAFLTSFGRNMPLLYGILFELLPFFNKFRAPVVVLHLIAFTIPLIGAYGLKFLIEIRNNRKNFDTARFKKRLMTSLAVLAAAVLLILMFKSGFRDMLSGSWFVKEGEADQYQLQYGQQARQVLEHLKQIRFDMFWGDALKFLVIALITVGTTLMFLNRKLRTTTTFIGILIVTLFVDLYIVDKEFVNPHPKADLDHAFKPDETIAFLKEQDGHFRVFPMGRLFGDNTYAYHGIHSIGGYSAAKLKIYQTMIDSCLYEGSDPSFPVNMSILNMLGVRYIVTPAEIPNSQFKKVNSDSTKGIFTYHNPLALPRVYLVDEAISARGDAEVFAMLNSPAFDPSRTAVLQDPAPTKVFPQDSSSSATILDYQARRILIEVNTSDPTLLVLSEVFYPAGWRALVDGTETPILRTNSILRSIMVPAGKHSVVFSFDPPMYEMGWQLTQIAWTLSSVLVLVPLTVYAVQAIRKRRQPPSPSDNGRQDVNSNS